MNRIVIAMLLAFAAARQSPTVWGGDHVELQVASNSATVEFDCAHGTIDAALKADSNGHFEIAGTFTPERSGPVRGDDPPPTLPATYAGTIKEDAMSLRVTIKTEHAPPPTTYELIRGNRGNVRKCR